MIKNATRQIKNRCWEKFSRFLYLGNADQNQQPIQLREALSKLDSTWVRWFLHLKLNGHNKLREIIMFTIEERKMDGIQLSRNKLFSVKRIP